MTSVRDAMEDQRKHMKISKERIYQIVVGLLVLWMMLAYFFLIYVPEQYKSAYQDGYDQAGFDYARTLSFPVEIEVVDQHTNSTYRDIAPLQVCSEQFIRAWQETCR